MKVRATGDFRQATGMPAIVIQGLLLFAGLQFAVMGIYALLMPTRIPAVFGVAVTTPEGRGEVRAVYGGYGLAVAGMLAFAAFSSSTLRPGILAALALSVLGMAVGRLAGAVVDRPRRFYPIWFFLLLEIFLAATIALDLR